MTFEERELGKGSEAVHRVNLPVAGEGIDETGTVQGEHVQSLRVLRVPFVRKLNLQEVGVTTVVHQALREMGVLYRGLRARQVLFYEVEREATKGKIIGFFCVGDKREVFNLVIDYLR